MFLFVVDIHNLIAFMEVRDSIFPSNMNGNFSVLLQPNRVDAEDKIATFSVLDIIEKREEVLWMITVSVLRLSMDEIVIESKAC